MPIATNNEALAEYAYNAGMDDPEREWILTPWDTWEKNPHYRGAPGRHPESDPEDFSDDQMLGDPEVIQDGWEPDFSDDIPF